VPGWLVVIVLSRDVIVVLGYFLVFVMTQRPMEVRPTFIGKGATFFQLASVSLVLLGLARGAPVLPIATECVFYLAGLLTAGAGLQYVHRGLLFAQGHEGDLA
jgi:phosphatidylglycerophosphate synthase